MTSSSPEISPAKRAMPRWLKWTVIGALVLANLIVLGLFWAFRTGSILLDTADTNAEVVSELSTDSANGLTFLVVGSDSREGLDDLTNFGEFGGERGDAIMLIHLDTSTGGAKMLSIPRDLWVDIPGRGPGKINAAYAFGGGPLIVKTITTNLGIPIHHYVEIGFAGFASLVDEVGGVDITFPYPARDVSSGLEVDAGTQRLGGMEALAYARSRKYQELQNGSWVSVDANDIGRTKRQQEVVRAVLKKLKQPGSITEAGDIAASLASHMTIDSSLAEKSVASLAWDFRSLLSGGLSGATLPVRIDTIGGQSVVVAIQPDAEKTIEAFLGSAQPISAPLRLQVLNGNGVVGAAGDMSELLKGKGFDVSAVGDATRSDYSVTTVVVPPGSTRGQEIVDQLGFGVVIEGSVDNGYDAVVIVGADAV